MIDPRIEQAASFLDQQDKDWFGRIDTNAIDMNHPRWCILGQAFGDYYGSGYAYVGPNFETVAAFNYDVSVDDWAQAIEARRSGMNWSDGPRILLSDLATV